MKITLWYESHNAHERLAAKVVAAKYPRARLIDVSTWTAMRDRPSESGWPDRHVRAFPCLVFDSADGTVELERVEGVVTDQDASAKEAAAKKHAKRVVAALAEAKSQNDVPGGARPVLIAEISRGDSTLETVVAEAAMVAPARSKRRKA
jgi:hypothetical protein